MPEQRSRPKEGRVIALANQKGGTGKTTTTVKLGIGLARLGQKVLLIDADPQGDLTTCLGWQDQDSLQTTLATIMEKVIRDEPFSVDEGILHHKEGVDLMPANIELSAMEMSLSLIHILPVKPVRFVMVFPGLCFSTTLNCVLS